ncbi:hypothetical protein B0H10DRAFT_2234246 [Mycena sp. CBHHK59/15]|nr:hypothetical protein B0H10DRAFT_2234246 [Mycena sp. CBHHK59/15]
MTTVVLVGSGARFLRFPDHLWGHGLNKILQEMVVMAYLAQLADRAFVFEDYTWSHSPLPYTLYDFALCPAYILLNSFVVGPLAGAPFPQYDSTTLAYPGTPPGIYEERSGHDRTAPPHARRAVSTAFYSAVCLPATVHTISSADAPRSHFSPSSPPPPPSPHDSPHPDFSLSGSKSVKFKSHAQQHDGSSVTSVKTPPFTYHHGRASLPPDGLGDEMGRSRPAPLQAAGGVNAAALGSAAPMSAESAVHAFRTEVEMHTLGWRGC